MAKKVLILSSSPRRGGNSDTLCDEFMRGAAESNHEVEKIFLRDKTIHYCTGCSTCSLYQKPCPQKDDAAEIIEKMVDADVIVMATPVYFYTISAQMKTLIDRCCGRYTEMNGKEFYFRNPKRQYISDQYPYTESNLAPHPAAYRSLHHLYLPRFTSTDMDRYRQQRALCIGPQR